MTFDYQITNPTRILQVVPRSNPSFCFDVPELIKVRQFRTQGLNKSWPKKWPNCAVIMDYVISIITVAGNKAAAVEREKPKHMMRSET